MTLQSNLKVTNCVTQRRRCEVLRGSSREHERQGERGGIAFTDPRIP